MFNLLIHIPYDLHTIKYESDVRHNGFINKKQIHINYNKLGTFNMHNLDEIISELEKNEYTCTIIKSMEIYKSAKCDYCKNCAVEVCNGFIRVDWSKFIR